MKKKSTSQSAFTLRLLIASVFCAASVVITLLGFGAFSVQAQQRPQVIMQSTDPLVPVGFDCSRVRELGIDKQENLRAGAIMIACGEAQGGTPSASSALLEAIKNALAPLAYGVSDVDLVTGTETSPNVTQSETFTASNPDDPNQIVVAYNDSRGRNASPINISGASVSIDGGNTFARLTNASGQSPFSNTFGDPVILYNRPTGTWFTVWLDGGCGGQGLGGYKSTTPSNANSWTHYCIHSNNSDDRESGWADNNPSSPFYGRMYVSWNDFNVGGGALFVRYSTDNGLTWTNARQITSGTPFIRDVQITGDLATGDVYIAGMNEGGGGFPHNNNNLFFRSTDGGNTWTNTYTGPSFPGPGVTAVSYFACMFSDGGGYWRHEGWGEPAVFNHVVSYVYDQHGTGSDPGNVYYIRSTDSGVTFSAPFKLNTDATTRPQWQPNLSVSPTGTLLAVWYDARESASCTMGSPGVPCYRMWARRSPDNGASWLSDQTFSDVVSPLPSQPDPGIQATYAGDYDYASSSSNQHLHAWVDGRVSISGSSQQDAFHDRQSVGAASPTPTATATATATPTATPTPTPVVTTNPATNVASFSATLNGSLNPRGSTTTVYFQYGLTTSYGSTTPMQTQTGNTVRAISANISGLAASHVYHFRIVAHNAGGTAYGSDRTFTTLSATGPPVVITNPATFIASYSAKLNGSVNPHGLTTTVYFQYGTTNSYGSTTANQTKTGNTYQNVAANISGLSASTTYHFRIVATNSAGTVYGSDRTVTTLSATGPPVVITNPATNVASSSATLNGSVDPHGLSTTVYFQYGTTTSYGSTTPNQTKTGNTYQNVAANISGLTASTTYHFRIVATNSGGTRYGGDRTFTTP